MLTVTDRQSDDGSVGRPGDWLAGCGKSSRCLLDDAAAGFFFAGFLRSDWPVPVRRLLFFSALSPAAFSALLSAPRTWNVDFSMTWRSESRCSKASLAE